MSLSFLLAALCVSPLVTAQPAQSPLVGIRAMCGFVTGLRGEALPRYAEAFTARGAPPAQSEQSEDDRRVGQIMGKQRRGEPVTEEEKAFVRSVLTKRSEQYAKAHPPREFTGMIPLSDLGKGTYKGEEGGLYPGGENVPPPAHLKKGLKIAHEIVPLDADGRKSEDGKIVLLSIGMSNTTMEFQTFQRLATAETDLNPRLVIVDGAQGGQTANITANPQANFWNVVDQRLSQAGVTPKQVEVVWIKQAIPQPSQPFPAEAKKLEGFLVDTLHTARDRFTSLKIAYLSNRIYAGYAVTPLNPEPHAYETAFSVKWVIADQIAGKAELNDDPAKGPVRSPWLAWGPYLWADGVKGRKDALVWLRDDLVEDGTHPSKSGREKVGKLLLDFLKKDPTSKPWFVK